MILGNLGRNLIVAHRRSIYRCAPEQLRFATESEQTVAEFSDNELLGIRNLLEKGQFPKSQFTDLVADGNPPSPDVVSDAVRSHSMSGALTAAESPQLAQQEATPAVPPVEASDSRGSSDQSHAEVPVPESGSSASYGPLRLRNCSKGPQRFQPLKFVEDHPEEFLEMMQGISTASESPDVPVESHSPRTSSHKCSASVREVSHEPPTHRPKHDADDSLFCQEVLSAVPEDKIPTAEVYLAAFLQKKAQKELAPTNRR